ncbi:MAG TPA: alpha/beta hydrolase [Bacteroidetes bacterium]|nr:alpha/beta hydrolase [Bacteroidota bacterium]
MNKTHLLSLLAALVLLVSCNKVDLSADQSDTLFVRADGADMPVYIRGNAASKKFILLVHGGPGGNGLEYRSGKYADQLEQSYAMCYWDQRGQGMSHGHYATSEVTVNRMAEDLHAVILALRFRYGQEIQVYVLGHSWGGMVGTAYMVGPHASEVQGWIEADGAHDIPLLNIELVKMIRQIGVNQVNSGNNAAYWSELLAYASTLDTNNITLDQSGELNGKAFEAEANHSEVYPGQLAEGSLMRELFFSPTNLLISTIAGNITADLLLAEAESTSFTNRLGEIQTPTLLLWGKYDFVVPPALGESALAKIGTSDKEMVLFEHSGHSPMDNEADAFVAAIRDWIARH